MKPDIDEAVELFFSHCLFDSIYMDETYIKGRIRHALESLSDEEYIQVVEKLRRRAHA